MSKRMRRIFISLGILSGLIVLLLVVGRFYIETDHARRLIQAKIDEMIPGAISFEQFRFSLLKGEFELKKGLLKDPAGDELAGFDRLFVDLSWTSLLRKDLTVEAMILEKPWARLRIDSEGRLNLMKAFPPSKPEKDKAPSFNNIVINSLKLAQGSLHYEMEANNLKAEVREIDLTAMANLRQQSGNLTFKTGRGSIDTPKIKTKFDRLRLEAALREGRIEPLIFKLGTSASELALSGNIQDALSRPFLDLNLDLSASLLEIQKILSIPFPLTGQIRAYLSAQGPLNNPEATLHFDYGGGDIAGNQIDGIEIDGQLKDRLLTLNRLQVNAASGILNIDGDIELQDAFAHGFLSPQRDPEAISYKLFLKMDKTKLEELFPPAHRWKLSGNRELKGTISSGLSFSGKGVSPRTLSAKGTLELLAEQLTVNKAAAPIDLRLRTKASLNKGVITFQQLKAEVGESRLWAEGRFDLASGEVATKLDLDAPDLTDSLSPLGIEDVSGGIRLKANVSGSKKHPVFDFVLKGNRLCFQDITIGDIGLKAALDQTGILRVSQLTIENQGSAIKGEGSIHVFKDFPLLEASFPSDFSLTLSNIEAKDFSTRVMVNGTIDGELNIGGNADRLEAALSLQGKDLAINAVRAGNISLAADLEGKLKQPKGRVDIQGTDIDLGFQKIKEISLRAELDGEKIQINSLQIALAPGEIIEGAGWVSLQKTYQLDLSSRGISLSHIDKIKEHNIIEGKVLFNISGKGDLEDPQIKGEIGVNNLRMGEKAFKDLQGIVDLRDQLLRISLSPLPSPGFSPGTLDGSFHLQKKDFSVSALFNETDLNPYFKMANQAGLGGILTGKIEAKGNIEAIDDIQAAADLSKLDIFFKGTEVLHSRGLLLSMRNKEILIPGANLRLFREGEIDLRGKGEINGPVDLQIKGNIPLKAASLFVDDLPDITGNAVLDAVLSGSLSKPDIRAEIKVEKAGLTVPGLSRQLHDVNGRIRMSPEAIVVDEIKGQLDTGWFALTGRIDLEGFQPAEVEAKLKAKAIPLKIPDTLDMLLDAELQARGTPEKSMITGEVVVLEGTYYKDADVNLSLIREAVQKKRETPPPPSKSLPPFLENMELDISIKHRQPFLIDNNLARLDISPDLRLYGKVNHPLISGRAEVESGRITYRKKTFEVKKGVLDFLNPYKIEPAIEVESEARVRDWLILLVVSGTPDQLSLKLASEPPEEHGDILSILMFDKTMGEFIEGEGGISWSPRQMIAKIAAKTAGESIRKTTGLDILDLELGRQGDGEALNGVKVTLGKELSRRMTIKYTIESKDGEMLRQAVTDYKFLENVLLSGFQDTKGRFGGEFQIRIEFR